jgi:uncharacterized membrane protein
MKPQLKAVAIGATTTMAVIGIGAWIVTPFAGLVLLLMAGLMGLTLAALCIGDDHE